MFKRSFIVLVTLLALLLAVPLTLAQDDPVKTVEFTGEITAIEMETTLTVAGFTVDASAAEVTATLEVGALVRVEGTLLDDGTIQATEVKPVETDSQQDGEHIRLIGALDSLTGDTAVVSGRSFDISGASVESGLAEGDTVKIEATYDADTDTWVASELEAYNDSNNDGTDDTDFGGDDSIDNSGNDNESDDNSNANDNSGSDDSGACVMEVEVSSASLRSGPGTGYSVLGYAYDGDKLAVQEVHSSGAWVNVGDAWIAASTGKLEGNCGSLPTSDVQFLDNSNSNDNSDDNSNDNSDDHSSNDNSDDNSNDNDDDHSSNDNSDDHNSNDNSDDHSSNDNSDDHNSNND